MGWHPDTEVLRGSRLDVEVRPARAGCAMHACAQPPSPRDTRAAPAAHTAQDAIAVLQRGAANGFETEEDTRPGITAATRRCRNGPGCRFYPDRCTFSHARQGYEIFWEARDAAMARLRAAGGGLTCDGYKARARGWAGRLTVCLRPHVAAQQPYWAHAPRRRLLPTNAQYTETTELWEAAQDLAVDAECVTIGEGESFESFMHIRHALLAPLFSADATAAAAAAAQPPRPRALTERAAYARLAPMLAVAVGHLDLKRTHSHKRHCGAERRLVADARAALLAGAASARDMPLADRIARMERQAEAMEARHNELRTMPAGSDEEEEDDSGMFDYYGISAGPPMLGRYGDAGSCLHLSAVYLGDALHAARGWLAEIEGRAMSEADKLLALLREAHAAEQDVLVYHNVG